MRAREFVVEGYQEAQTEFAAAAGAAEPPQKTIQMFKDLVNKNQIKDQQRNIDYWRKLGWIKFSEFVQSIATLPTKTAVKRQKVPGQSINLVDDAVWLIVIPLDKNASCFHGKGSDWCTTKPAQTHFEQYFYDNEIVLVYCLHKQTGGMWALAMHTDSNSMEIFDQRDTAITSAVFKAQTGLAAAKLRALAFEKQNIAPVVATRIEYKTAVATLGQLLASKKRMIANQQEIEKLILYTGRGDAAATYIKSVGAVINIGQQVQITAVKNNGLAIEYIKNPSQQVQIAAVGQSGYAIKYIKNPSQQVQIAAVKNDGHVIEYIKNPSQQLQITAVGQNGRAIEYIKNPSQQVQITAVGQNGLAIKYIENPSEQVQITAVGQNGLAIKYIEYSSEQVQITAVGQNSSAIEYIENPSRQVQIAAQQKNTGYAR